MRAFAKLPVDQKTQISVGLAGRKALYALTHGQAPFADLKELTIRAYSGQYLAERGYGLNELDDFQLANYRFRSVLLVHRGYMPLCWNGDGYDFGLRSSTVTGVSG